jgi:hypothetical protein
MNTNKIPQSTTVLPVGTKVRCMIVGKPLTVEILAKTADANGSWLGCEYKARYIGDAVVCLDFGQNWNAKPGDIFTVRQGNIDSALEWLMKGY